MFLCNSSVIFSAFTTILESDCRVAAHIINNSSADSRFIWFVKHQRTVKNVHHSILKHNDVRACLVRPTARQTEIFTFLWKQQMFTLKHWNIRCLTSFCLKNNKTRLDNQNSCRLIVFGRPIVAALNIISSQPADVTANRETETRQSRY